MEGNTGTCLVHADRAAAGAHGPCRYCASCLQEIAAVVPPVVPGGGPRDCFAASLPNGAWRAHSGPGSAHWLAHELHIRALPSHVRCAAGFPVRRADLLFGRRERARELPQPRDLWIDLDDEGCGLVVRSWRGEGDQVEISIRGIVAATGQLGVRDFYRDLSGRGRFFR